MRSAIYYPRAQVYSRSIMQSSLLLWDELYTIVPDRRYAPDDADRDDMAAAWEVTHGGGPDARQPSPPKVRDIYIPDLRLGSGIKAPTRDFR